MTRNTLERKLTDLLLPTRGTLINVTESTVFKEPLIKTLKIEQLTCFLHKPNTIIVSHPVVLFFLEGGGGGASSRNCSYHCFVLFPCWCGSGE